MKTKTILWAAFVTIMILAFSCKAAGRLAAKYWLNREIREFVTNCEDKTAQLIGVDNARKYCDCAVDLVAEKYRDYKDAKSLSVLDILDFINKCK